MPNTAQLKDIPMRTVCMWAGFFANPARNTEIEVELKASSIPAFIERYRALAGQNARLPAPSGPPFTVLDDSADKWGVELRLYFLAPREVWMELPDPTVKVTRDTRWSAAKKGPYHRISTKGFVNHMFKLGFQLGRFSHKRDYSRIRDRVPAKYRADFDKGYNLSL